MISALSFLFNEEEGIERALLSIKDYVDEIIIFDLESTDNTFSICSKYTDKVFKVPYLLCGDGYKQDLLAKAKGDYVLWFYGDEYFPKRTMEILNRLTTAPESKWNAFGFMRHEYMDDIRLNFKKDNEIVEYGTTKCPNYQIRLVKRDPKIFYTELVHAELHGEYSLCPLPTEFFMEHHKTSKAQEFDNARLYIWYCYLVWKYGDTKVEPYKRYVESYRKIIKDSRAANLAGTRTIHPAEEFWADWRKFANCNRMSLQDFERVVGVEYCKLVSDVEATAKTLLMEEHVVDRAVKESVIVENK